MGGTRTQTLTPIPPSTFGALWGGGGPQGDGGRPDGVGYASPLAALIVLYTDR